MVAVRISDDPQAGYLAPAEMAREIIKNITEFSPLRQVAGVRSISRSSLQVPKKTGSGTATWVSEVGERAEVTGLKFGLEEITPHEMSYLAKVSLQMLEDVVFNLEGELSAEFGEAFGSLEGTAFISGNGVGKPEGILTHASISDVPGDSAGAISANDVVNTFYALKDAYAKNGTWLMRRSTVNAIRLLKDAVSGQYMWQPGLHAGQPSILLGHPILECPDMPAIASNALAVAFGDFRRAYMIVDRVIMAVQRLAEKYAEYGQVGFLARRRVDGQVVLPEAIVRLKIHA